jgi:hypothetical protein
MSVTSILHLLKELNKIVLCESFCGHNIILSNKFNKFRNEATRMQYSIYHISKIRTV